MTSADWHQGFRDGHQDGYRAGLRARTDRRTRVLLFWQAMQGVAGILLAASGRWPEKRGL